MSRTSTPMAGAVRLAEAGILAVALLASAAARGDPRVVLIEVAEAPARAEEIAELLRASLEAVSVEVEVHAPLEAPRMNSQWASLAAELARARPATLALAGLGRREGDGRWFLLLVEPGRGAMAEIPLQAKEPEHGWPGYLARTLEAVILGELLPELGLLAGGGAALDREAREEWEQAGHESPEPAKGGMPLRIEGGYQGEYGHPQGPPIHGPFVGLALQVHPALAPALQVGWLGVQRIEGAAGEVACQRVPLTLALRLLFEAGPAAFAVAPVGRIDAVFVRSDPAGKDDARVEVDLELHVGALFTLRLPVPGGLEALIGAGVLATVLGNDREIAGERILAASSVRLAWMAGLAWNPRAP